MYASGILIYGLRHTNMYLKTKANDQVMPRIYITLKQVMMDELEKLQEEKGYFNVQSAIREILGDWYAKRKKEG